MRIATVLVFVLLGSAALVAAEPTPQPYPDGPLLRVSVSNAAQVRERLTTTWYGRWWLAPAAEPLRKRVAELMGEGESATGIAWGTLFSRASGFDLVVGDRAVITIAGADPTAVLAGVDAAMVADEQRMDDYRRAQAAWTKQMAQQLYAPGKNVVAAGPQVSSFAPVQRSSAGVVLGRVRAGFEEGTRDEALNEWLVRGAENTVTISHPADQIVAATIPPPAGPDISIALDLAAYADASGIPGAGSFLRRCGAIRAVGGIDLAPGRSQETVVLAGARLPLRPLDTAVLEAEIPAHALALTAIGIDGPALARVIAAVAAEESGLQALSEQTMAALSGIDGTAWLAVTPGMPLPDMAIGLPATAAVDAWLERAFPLYARLFAQARQRVVVLEPSPPGLPSPFLMRRTARAWVFGTSAAVFDQAGMPGLAGRLAHEHQVPPNALAVGLQATQAILQRVGTYALIAQLWLATQTPVEEAPRRLVTGNEEPEMRFTRQQLADLRMLAGAFPGLVTAAKAPTTVGYLLADAQGATVHGRDLVIGMTTLPLLAASLNDLVPLVAPEWTVRCHALMAARWSIARWPWVDQEMVSKGWRWSPSQFPPPNAQLRALALRAPQAWVRGQALWLMSYSVSNHERDLPDVLTWMRCGLADAHERARNGALRGLGTLIDRPGALPLLLGAFSHADAQTRRAAYQRIADVAAQYRHKQRHPHTEWNVRLPPALEALLAAESTEREAEATVPLMQALGGYDDPRAAAALARRLDDPAAAVALAAAEELSWPPFIADHQAAVFACVLRLRADHTPTGEAISKQATAVLYERLTGAEADALIVQDLQLPDPRKRETEEMSPRFAALAALVSRGYAPALSLADAALQPLPDDPTLPWALLYALSQCPLAEAEPLMERTLRLADPRTHPGVRSQALSAIGMRAAKRPLNAVTVSTMIDACLLDPAAARTSARRLVERQKLSSEHAAALAQAVQQATTRYGDQAFPGYTPPKIPEPEPPPLTTGADDF